jgi:SOUL heme-binding protein
MKKLFLLCNALFLAGCSVFGIHDVKEARYQVIKDDDAIQIRQYQPYIVAQTAVMADYRTASNVAFRRLFAYINGDNKKQQKIAMTAPVIQSAQAEKIAMTAPVVQEKSGGNWQMAFVLPEGYTLENTPIPLDRMITIKVVPAKKTAVLQYSGFLTENNMATKTNKLAAWLVDHHYVAISPARSAGFDPPWTLPFLRRNEIHIDIQ